jgi:hypothetical protein
MLRIGDLSYGGEGSKESWTASIGLSGMYQIAGNESLKATKT